jgi:hypothetical protein
MGIKNNDKSDYINEIFLYYKLTEHRLQNSYNFLSIFIKLYLYCKSFILAIFSFLITIFSSLLLPAFVLVRSIFINSSLRQSKLEKIAIFRAPASYQKMKFLKDEGVCFLSDDLVFKKKIASIYSTVDFFSRLLSCIWVPILSVVDFYKVMQDSTRMMGFLNSGAILLFFSKRIAQKCTFEFYVSSILKNNPVKSYYTGNKEDRFAMMEDRLCKRYEVESICIPHGLEYAYKMPGGLIGDKFYCTSENARALLSKLYKDGKNLFIFDQGIVRKMLSVGRSSQQNKKIVFFPESRDPKTNLLIMEYLIDSGFKLHVKFHIKDNIKNYCKVRDNIIQIDSFDEAISGNICIARKSTVLLEALYNSSVSIAALIASKDKAFVDTVFPSLQDSRINRAESFEELKCLIKSNIT